MKRKGKMHVHHVGGGVVKAFGFGPKSFFGALPLGERDQGCPSLPSESIVHRWESHCTMGQVGLSMGIHCPTWVHSIPLPPYHVGQVGMTMGIPCTTHILLYHVGQVGRPMEYHPYPQCCPRSYCPSYPTVPCRTGGTSNGIPPIPPVLPQILLSVLSYCTM